jgi:CheY-like chemotaxis protein
MVLMDVRMTEMGGITATQVIRKLKSENSSFWLMNQELGRPSWRAS